MQSDSDESLLDNKSCSESYSSSEPDDVDSDDSSDDVNLPTTSLAAQRSRGGRSQARTRNNYVWNAATRQPHLESFTGNSGPTSLADVTDMENCLEYFQLIITDEVLEIVVDETNRYANQFFQSAGALPSQSRANNWKPLTLPELKVFLGLTLLTGMIGKRGHLSEYWSKNPLFLLHFMVKQCQEIVIKSSQSFCITITMKPCQQIQRTNCIN